jgi:glycosyltransferase involved in cell wall biosynthesis
MKVSFSIPAYNEEAIIADCLKAVLAEIKRSGVDAEVVVVNNASTDKTKEIALTFPGVRVVDEPKKGLTHARAAGMRATSGEVIANVDSDTVLPQGWLTTVAREFETDPKLVALSGPFIYHDLSAFDRALSTSFYVGGYLLHRFLHLFGIGGMVQGGNFVIKRAAFEKVGGFDTTIVFYGEDTDVAERLSKVGTVRWTWRLPMYASGRRLKKEGVFKTGWTYMLNFFSVNLLKRPVTHDYTDIRPPTA